MSDSAAQRIDRSFFWKVWGGIAAFTVVVLLTQHGNVPAQSSGIAQTTVILVLGIILILIASVLRWVVILRAKDARSLVIAMVAGLVLSESVGFFGLYLLPSGMTHSRTALFALSLLSIIQFVPTYAKGAKAAQP